MKIIVSFSGGKDSQACLIHAVKTYGASNVEAVFCDTGWEHKFTYQHVLECAENLEVKLIVLKSKRGGFEEFVVIPGYFINFYNVTFNDEKQQFGLQFSIVMVNTHSSVHSTEVHE